MSFFHNIPSISLLPFLFILLIASFFDIISCSMLLEDKSCSDPNGSLNQSNLATILGKLSAKASLDGFFSTEVGEKPDKIFGLAICLAGFAQSSCQNCIESAVKNISSICSENTRAVLWHDHCMVHYAVSSFFGIPNTDYSKSKVWGNSEPNGGGLETTVYNLINNLSDSAANNETRFALGQENYLLYNTGNVTIYGLAQCTRDLSAESCSTCLTNYSSVLKKTGVGSTYTGGRVLGESCFIWYDNEPFNNFTTGSSPSPGDSGSSPPQGDVGSHSKSIIIAVASACTLLFLLGVALWFWRRKRTQMNIADSRDPENVTSQELILIKELQLQEFELKTLQVATKNFSPENFLGEGGYGAVYKGILKNGTEIAVKKLKEGSKQGTSEFKAEVRSLAALKHRNLVQLIGYYIDAKVQLLCYEYLPNGSLDQILFGRCNGNHQVLSWEKRLIIAKGISCVLRYVQEESPNGIVHRDLKPANILLDEHMNPKLADFGTAKFFKDDQTHNFTRQPKCTLGYVAPEYRQFGQYSYKSDVYSFGVTLLEIVTGQKILPSLIKNVIKKWIDGTIDELKDPKMGTASLAEIKRCIQIGLCCVHETAANRPTFGEIDLMLGGHLDVPPVSEEWLKSWMNISYTTIEAY